MEDENEDENCIVEREVLEFLLVRIGEMINCHKKKELLFVRQDFYPRHNVSYPPDSVNREKNESDDIYYLFVELFKMITGEYPPMGFQVNRGATKLLKRKMIGWESGESLSNLFRICTSLNQRARPHNIDVLMELPDFRNLHLYQDIE